MRQFTPGELEVMRILWQHGEQKPGEIQEHFDRPIENSAVRSYLSILLDKGHIVRRREGKSYVYKAKTRQDSVFHTMIRDVADMFCGGSKQALLCRLIKSEKISEKELQALKKLADEE